MTGLGIRLAGPFAVVRGSAVLTAGQVGSRKARLLLATLAAARHRAVPVDRLVSVLWPDQPPSRPAESVATLVSRLRAALGPEAVAGDRAGYRIGPPVTIDLVEAERLLGEAAARLGSEPALALAAARAAADLLAPGPLLIAEDERDWLTTLHTEQGQAGRRARAAIAAAALRCDEPEAARDAAVATLDEDPLDEAAARALMTAQAALGQSAAALSTYERLRARLAEELGADPGEATREVHLAILRGNRTEESPGTTRSAPAERLAGRTAELARITTAWRDATTGTFRLMLLAGEAGIGKTALADELSRLARDTGGLVLTARCYEAERSLFLQPVIEALTALVVALPPDRLRQAAGDRAAALAGLMPEVAAMLGAAPAERASADMERRRAYEAVTVFLGRLARDESVLLVLDDLQHAGEATIELLHFLARRIGTARLLVAGTVRAEEGRTVLATLADAAETVLLGPLDTPAIARLAAAAGQEAHLAQIEQRTRGHTLFVVETLRGLAAGERGVPATLRDSVLARVARAGPDAEEVLRAAAVIGASFAPATVAGLLGVDRPEATRRCEQLLATRLTVVSGRAYEFANDLIQEVLYATTPGPTRTAHHLHAADLLADNPEALARHAAAAGDRLRAGRAWLAAGQRAAARYASADADALFTSAVAAAGDDPELLGRAYLARGRAREMMFQYEDALTDYAEAVRLAHESGDRRLEMSAHHALGGPAWAGSGRAVGAGVASVHRALRLAGELGDRGAEAGQLGWLAVLSSNQLHFENALDYGERAVRAARASGDDGALAAALDGLKNAWAYLGEVGPLTAVLAELEPLVRRTGNLWLLQWLTFESAFPHLAAGRWDQADNLVAAAKTLNERSGYTGCDGWFLAHRAWIARLAGRMDTALELGARATELDSHSWFAAAVLGMHGTTLMEAGRHAEVVPILERGLALAEANGTEAYRLRCLAPLAEATGSAAYRAAADQALRSITTRPGSAWLYGADTYVSLARAWTAAGRPERATEILTPLLAAAGRTGWTAPMAAAREAAAQSSSASSSAARSAPSVSTGR